MAKTTSSTGRAPNFDGSARNCPTHTAVGGGGQRPHPSIVRNARAKARGSQPRYPCQCNDQHRPELRPAVWRLRSSKCRLRSPSLQKCVAPCRCGRGSAWCLPRASSAWCLPRDCFPFVQAARLAGLHCAANESCGTTSESEALRAPAAARVGTADTRLVPSGQRPVPIAGRGGRRPGTRRCPGTSARGTRALVHRDSVLN